MKSNRLNNVFCLSCNEQLVGSTSVTDDNELPDEGAVSICFNCGGIALFTLVDGDFALRPGTIEELESINADEGVRHVFDLMERAKGGQL